MIRKDIQFRHQCAVGVVLPTFVMYLHVADPLAASLIVHPLQDSAHQRMAMLMIHKALCMINWDRMDPKTRGDAPFDGHRLGDIFAWTKRVLLHPRPESIQVEPVETNPNFRPPERIRYETTILNLVSLLERGQLAAYCRVEHEKCYEKAVSGAPPPPPPPLSTTQWLARAGQASSASGSGVPRDEMGRDLREPASAGSARAGRA
jgi:hypothetical protein